MRRTAQALSILVLAAGAAGCGGSDDDESTTAASTPSTATTAAPPTTATAPTTASDGATRTGGTTSTADAAPTATTVPSGGGNVDEYAGTYERECAKLVSTLGAYQRTFSGERPRGSAGTEAAIIRTYKTRTKELLNGLRSMFQTLGALEAPAEYVEFQRSIAAVVPQVDLKVDRAIRVVDRIRTAKQAPTAGDDVKEALGSISSDGFPASLKGRAPSCQRIG